MGGERKSEGEVSSLGEEVWNRQGGGHPSRAQKTLRKEFSGEKSLGRIKSSTRKVFLGPEKCWKGGGGRII